MSLDGCSLLVSVLVGSLAGSASSAPPQRRPIQMAPTYSTSGFTGAIPPHFQGNDVQSIVDYISSRAPEKGEFETTDAYAIRLAAFNNGPLPGGIARDADLAFVFPTEKQREGMRPLGIMSRYDADEESMEVRLTTTQAHVLVRGGGLEHSIGVQWLKVSQQESDGNASNSYGVHVKVHYVVTEGYGISLPLDLESQLEEGVSFAIPPAEAKEIKDRLRILVVGSVAPSNPVVQGLTSTNATISEPVDYKDITHYLKIVPSVLAVFDDLTGKIYMVSAFIPPPK